MTVNFFSEQSWQLSISTTNLHRESKVDEKNNSKLKVTYPKFKEGQAVVREIKVEQNYGKCNYYLKVLAETVSF